MIAPSSTGEWFYHEVDMSQAGNGSAAAPKGAITSTNNQLLPGSNTYLPAIAVVADNSLPSEQKVYVYTLEQQTNASEVRLVGYVFGADLNLIKVYEGPVQTANNELAARLQLSPDGNLLVSMTHQGSSDPVNQVANGGTAISVYQLNNSSEDRSLNYVKTISNTQAQQLLSMQFGDNNDRLYYTNATTTAGHKLHRLSLTTQADYSYASDLLDRTAIIRTAAGNLYTATANATALQAIDGDVLVADALVLPADYSLTGKGIESTQPHSISSPLAEQLYFAREVGLKQYELKDHLGNVRTVVSDRLYSEDVNGTTQYSAGVVSATDYYAFGMSMPGRSYNNAEYRYGFNGKEKDPEGMGGGGSTYDYGFRIYNPRIAKFLSVDPLTKSYPMLTPYQFASNRPIDGIDLDGLEYVHYAIYLDSDGLTVLRKETIKDYRNMNNEDIHDNFQTSSKYYYQANSQSHGPAGEGVAFTYFQKGADGEYIEMDTRMENSQRTTINSLLKHGMFYGSGAVTKFGPKFGQGIGKYDFDMEPIDMVDQIAKLHDMEEEVADFDNYGELQFIGADIRFVNRLKYYLGQSSKDGYIDPYTGKPASGEAQTAAANAIGLFEDIIKTKLQQIESGYKSGTISTEEYQKYQDIIGNADPNK